MKAHSALPIVKKPVEEDWDPEASFFAAKEEAIPPALTSTAPGATSTVPSLVVPPKLVDSMCSSSPVASPHGTMNVKQSPISESSLVNSKDAVTSKGGPETPEGAEETPEREAPKSPKREMESVQSFVDLDVKQENPKAGQYLETKKHATELTYDAHTLQEFENAIFQALTQLYKTFQASSVYQPRGTMI